MKFQVTEEDIQHGKRGDCDTCPVALSIKRELRPLSELTVGIDSFHIGKSGFQFGFLFPVKVKKFILRFDNGKPVKPFSFSIPNLERIMQ